METNTRQQWEEYRYERRHRESKYWQYEMIQKLFTTSVVPVIPVKSYYYGTTWSVFPSPSSSPSPELSHVATKGAFAPAEDRREAEGRACSHFSPAKRTLAQRTASGGDRRRQCYSKGLCTPRTEGPGDATAASTLYRGPHTETTSPQDGSKPARIERGKELRRRDSPLLTPPSPIKPPFTSCPKHS